MDVTFDDRAVIVTGAGNGLGREYALEVGRRGGQVVVNDYGGSTEGTGGGTRAADYVVEEIRSAGGQAVASYDSVATREGCENIAATCRSAYGKVDVVIHNAGIARNVPFDEMSDENWFPVLETHLLGAFYLTRAVWPSMVERGYGRFVFTASATGVWGRAEGANYAAAKGGVFGLCNSIALEGEPKGILANAIFPVALTRISRANSAPEASDASAEALQRREAAAKARRSPDWVAPLAVYLASEACAISHRNFSSVQGRYAEVFVGVTDGWLSTDDTPPSVEKLVEHFDTVADKSSFIVPRGSYDESNKVAARVAAELS